MKLPPVLVLLLALPASAQCPSFAEGFHPAGFDADVDALATFDDGSGEAVYAGGTFTLADGRTARHLARYDGTTWHEVGGGVDGFVTALFVFDDGSGSALYVGGNFATAGGVACANVARWDGTSFTSLGAGFDGVVLELGAYDDGSGAHLYAGGLFTQSGATPCNHVARFDGFAWSDVGGGVDSAVEAFAVFQGELVVAGTFSHAGASSLNAVGIARWNGSTWSTFGASGLPAAAHALAVYDPGTGPKLYAGGEFFEPFPSFGHVARWSGSAWESPGLYVNAVVNALLATTDAHGPALYVGGVFTLTSGFGAVLRIEGNAASSFQPSGLLGTARALATTDLGGVPNVVAGGTLGDPSLSKNVARHDGGTKWLPIGDGDALFGTVDDLLVVRDGPLAGTYGGGRSLIALGQSEQPVVRWDGTNWVALGAEPVVVCRGLRRGDVGQGERIFAAFDEYGPIGVWSWDGALWTQLGVAGAVGTPHVYDVELYDAGSGPELYAVGQFTSMSGVPAQNVARWDGTSWHAVDGGLGAR